MEKDTIYAHLLYTLTELFQFVDCIKSLLKWNVQNIQYQIFNIKISNVPLISFYYIFVCYLVDSKLSENDNFISIAISGGLSLFWHILCGLNYRVLLYQLSIHFQ